MSDEVSGHETDDDQEKTQVIVNTTETIQNELPDHAASKVELPDTLPFVVAYRR
jgi:hypothetical protein